jgi:K+ transporter
MNGSDRVQPLGTERIGKAFGPMMTLWFISLALA